MWRDPSIPTRRDGEEGIALVYVIFATMVLAGLATVFVARAVFETRSTADFRNRESAIHVAEAGAEAVLGLINDETEEFSGKVVTEGPTVGNDAVADHVYDPPNGLTDEQLQAWEESWAIALAEADWDLAGRTSYTTRVVETEDGQAFAVRPAFSSGTQAYDAVFGVGFVPSIDAENRRVRVIKMLIARRYYSPDHALLAGGDLKFGGNASIVAPGCDTSNPNPLDCNADVHANGNVSITGSSAAIQGSLTASGTVTGASAATTVGGSVSGGEEPQEVPEIDVRNFYNRPVSYNADPGGRPVDWNDLCPDGTVRAPAASPCTGAVRWTSGGGNSTYLGWQWRPSQNAWKSSAVDAGIFYVYHADAEVTGADGNRAVTIFVESNPANVTKSGSLTVTGNPAIEPAFPDVLFITDRDLKLKGNAVANNTYSGLISVGEQLDVSGTVALFGAIIVDDREDLHPLVTRNTAGVNGTMILSYDDSLKIDITGRVTIEFWNEL